MQIWQYVKYWLMLSKRSLTAWPDDCKFEHPGAQSDNRFSALSNQAGGRGRANDGRDAQSLP